MKSITGYLYCLVGLTALTLFNACSHQTSQEQLPALIQPDGYEIFVKAYPEYPNTMVIYRNTELMKKASPDCPIYICLSQQRGRLYVDGKVAADWPVSTGTSNHPTPTGTFRVLEKKKNYSSRTWGKIYDAAGNCVNSNADSRTDSVPEGGKFVGSAMPNWHRMTGGGIGMHTGKVRAGRQLSHGCIRTPGRMANELFSITATGRTHITVTRELESCYPTFVGTIAEQQARIAAATGTSYPGAQNQPTPAEQLVVISGPASPVAQQQPEPAAQQIPTPVAQQQPEPAAQSPRTYVRTTGGVKVHSAPAPL